MDLTLEEASYAKAGEAANFQAGSQVSHSSFLFHSPSLPIPKTSAIYKHLSVTST